MTKKNLPVIFSILLILVVPLLAFWQVTFAQFTMKCDIMDQFLPCRYFLSECFRNKTLPLWCPYINFGYPFYADPQGGFFYPVTWLIAVLFGYNATTISAEFLLHVAVAAFSFYLLLRHFRLTNITAPVFGICYSLSGIFLSNAQHLSWIISLAWMPLVLVSFLTVLSKPSLLASLLLGISAYLMLTGGYPAFIIMLFYIIALLFFFSFYENLKQKNYAAFKERSTYLLAGSLLALLLSAGFLYSLWQALPYVDRGNSISEFEANSIPFTLQAMVSFVFPFVTVCRSYPMFTDGSMVNIYGGLLLFPFMLVAIIKQKLPLAVWLILAVGVVYLLAAFGKALPVRSWLYYTLPGMNVFRHAAIFRGLSLFAFLLVAAYGFDYVFRNPADRLYVRTITVFSAMLLAILLVSLYRNSFFYAFPPSLKVADWNYYSQTRNALTHLSAQVSVQLFLLGILLLTLWVKQLQSYSAYTMVFVMCVDIAIAAQMNVPGTVVSEVTVSHYNNVLQAMPKGFPIPALKPVGNISHLSDGTTQPTWYNASLLYKHPAKDGFNNFFLKGMPTFHESNTGKKWMQYPLAFFTSELTKGNIKPDSTVSYGIVKYNPTEMHFDYTAKQNTNFVFMESRFPGWNATCDEESITINTVENLFMGVNAPLGTHKIVFRFEPKGIVLLFVFTVFSFFASVLSLSYLLYKKPNDLPWVG
jgi:hypothetical protein